MITLFPDILFKLYSIFVLSVNMKKIISNKNFIFLMIILFIFTMLINTMINNIIFIVIGIVIAIFTFIVIAKDLKRKNK